MTSAWEGFGRAKEAPDVAHQGIEGCMPMVASHGVMQLLPQPLDDIDPWTVGGLENQVELWMAREPVLGHPALVNGVVVDDKGDPPRPSISAVEPVEEVDE